MIELTKEQRMKIQDSLDEWKDMLYLPERYEYVTYSIPNDLAVQLREYPEIFYRRKKE
jgi:hypothetical protein